MKLKYISFFLCWPLWLCAQVELDADEFFTRVMTNLNEEVKGQVVDFKFPKIEQVQVRTETHDFELDEQEFLLRISPSTPKKIRAQEDLYRHFASAPDLMGREMICDSWQEAHEDWLKLYIIESSGQYLKGLLTILSDKQTVFERLAGSGDLELEKLVDLQTEKSDLDIRLRELELEQNYLLDKYGFSERLARFDQFITIDYVKDVISLFASPSDSLQDEEIAYDLDQVKKEIALEEAEGKQFLDFAQIRYRGPHTDLFEERLSLGVGFQILNSGNRKLKIQELLLQEEELKREDRRKRELTRSNVRDIYNQISKDLEAYDFFIVTTEKERQELFNLGQLLSTDPGYSPLVLLEIEERNLKNRLDQLEKLEELIEDYIRLLEASGNLCLQPLQNFLSR